MSIDTSTTGIRTLDGVELPAAGTYDLDASHSHVGFSVRHLMVAKVRGRFGSFSGTIDVADDPLASSVSVTIDAGSIDTRDEGRDGHLRSADFFDVEQFPAVTFRSTAVQPAGKGRFAVTGDLTVRDVTRPVTLDLTLEGMATDPWGGSRAVFSGSTEIDRDEFGLTWNQALETGGVLVGRKITIEIEAEAVRRA